MGKRVLVLLLLFLCLIGCKESGLNLKIRYDQVQGLKEGDRVIFEQNPVGQVVDVFYSKDGHYEVDVVIKKDFSNSATEDAKFFIITDPLDERKKAVEIVQRLKGGRPLADGVTVLGSVKSSAHSNQIWEDLGKTLEDLKKQFNDFSDSMRKIPESEEFKKLKEELERLLEEMKKTGKSAGEKIQKEVLPRLEEELEKLREELRKIREKQEGTQLEVQIGSP